MSARTELLAQLEDEIAQGFPPPYYPMDRYGQEWSRTCRNGHRITEWQERPNGSCLVCVRIATARRLQRIAAASGNVIPIDRIEQAA